jgi:hypothetical protein
MIAYTFKEIEATCKNIKQMYPFDDVQFTVKANGEYHLYAFGLRYPKFPGEPYAKAESIFEHIKDNDLPAAVQRMHTRAAERINNMAPRVVEHLAAQIIKLSERDGQVTETILRQEANVEQWHLDRFGGAATLIANEMAQKGPFLIVNEHSSNNPPSGEEDPVEDDAEYRSEAVRPSDPDDEIPF